MNKKNRQKQKHGGKDKTSNAHLPIPIINSTTSNENGPKGTEQGEDSTHLQETTRWRRFKKWLFKITIAELGMFLLTLVITGSSIYYTKYAKRQWKVMRDQLEISERPWVDANISLDGPLFFNVNGANLQFVFQLMNTGHSPALAMQIAVRPQTGFFSPDPSEYRDDVCKQATRQVIEVPTFGMSLFPNQPFTQRERILFGSADIAKAINKSLGEREDEFQAPAIVFCIGYRSTFNDSIVYHTSYIVDLYRFDSANRLVLKFKIGEDVPLDHLRMQLHPVKSIMAD